MNSPLAKCLVSLALFLFASLGTAEAVEITPKEIALGDILISSSDFIERKIKIRNDASGPLFLTKIRTSCSCIILSSKEKKEIKQGETYAVKLRLNLKELGKGRFRRYLFLHFENAEKPLYVVPIHGSIL